MRAFFFGLLPWFKVLSYQRRNTPKNAKHPRIIRLSFLPRISVRDKLQQESRYYLRF